METLPKLVFRLSEVLDVLNDQMKLNAEGKRDKPKVVVIVGAGMSVNADLGDYRSAGGMYEKMDASLLTATARSRELIREDASNVMSREVFEDSPSAMYEVKRELFMKLPTLKPTAAHHCLGLLEELGVLHRVLTQNIDGLELDVLPTERVLQLHGNAKAIRCHYCDHRVSLEDFVAMVSTQKDWSSPSASETTSPPICCPECGRQGLRPDVILYGEGLKDEVVAAAEGALKQADLLLVLGTSLTVEPVSKMPTWVPDGCPRVVVSKAMVGEGTSEMRYGRGRDIHVAHDCDLVMSTIVRGLGAGSALAARADRMPPTSQRNLQVEWTEDALDVPRGPQGVRIECMVRGHDDLCRNLTHSREARIEIPALETDFSSHVTGGMSMSLGEFIKLHAEEIRKNMQMVFGGGSGAGIASFLDSLQALADGRGGPWRLVVDDPTGEASLTHRTSDTDDTYREFKYPLSSAERRLIGCTDDF